MNSLLSGWSTALLVCLLVLPWPLGAQTQWLVSDSLGTTLPEATPRSKPGKGWFLGIERLGSQEKRTLLLDGIEKKVFVLDFDEMNRLTRSRTFQGGLMVDDLSYQAGTAWPSREVVLTDGQPSLQYDYVFGTEGLSSRKATNPSGVFLYEDKLSRLPDGRLRRLERDGPEGPLAEVSWTYNSAGLAQLWVADEDLKAAGRHKLVTYGVGSVREDLLENLTLLLSRVTTDQAGGGTTERENSGKENAVIDRVRDARGRQVLETVSIPGQPNKVRRWIWDDKDRVTHEETDIPGGLETIDLAYEADQIVTVYRRLGQVTARQTEVDGEKVLVELFDHGEKFLEEAWHGGRKITERYFAQGQLVRERKL